jgi:protoporphyrin/coproporphyrin ferrochelatase
MGQDAAVNSSASYTSPDSPAPYGALLLVSFGAPEGPDEVGPFLENVVRGRRVPAERLAEVARHYDRFGGKSPLNDQNRAILAALVAECNARGPRLPVYWGNLHWHPMLTDTIRQMAGDGVRHALAFVTSAFGSPPTCRHYREAIERARETVGRDAPTIEKLRLFYNHPGFVEAMADRVETALDALPADRRNRARLIYTAHSIPLAMAARSPYERQLREACRLVTERMASGKRTEIVGWDLAFQSRSGPPAQPWLGPSVAEHLRELDATGGLEDVVLAPIGFLAENMEVVYDLDVEVGEFCKELGVNMVRAPVVGNHPRLVEMIRELVLERLEPETLRLALGADGPWPDECPGDCCQPT